MMADDARAVTSGLDSALRRPSWAAAKTGTSKATRDNWCVGFSDRYTVAVWIGNSEGDSMSRVSGTSGAAPVWRDLMLALHRDRPGRAPPRPSGVDSRTIAFADGIEPPRPEYFLRGTAQSLVESAPPAARRRASPSGLRNRSRRSGIRCRASAKTAPRHRCLGGRKEWCSNNRKTRRTAASGPRTPGTRRPPPGPGAATARSRRSLFTVR